MLPQRVLHKHVDFQKVVHHSYTFPCFRKEAVSECVHEMNFRYCHIVVGSIKCKSMVEICVKRMTQEEVGNALLEILSSEEEKGLIPVVEEAGCLQLEMQEAAYKYE